MQVDVVIVGGGPAGLSAALTLGRACKSVLLCDAGPRRNAAAAQMHNFVSRDGTAPEAFRAVSREQLRAYPQVQVRDVAARAIGGRLGAFVVELDDGSAASIVTARRVILCTGLRDEPLALPGWLQFWGHSIVQCPFCHGWEARGQRWAFVGGKPDTLAFVLMLRGWSRDVTLFTHAMPALSDEWRQQLDAAGVAIEPRPIARLEGSGDQLQAVILQDDAAVPCDLLFAHPPQHQAPLVASLGLALDSDGLVQTDPMSRETSVRGIYAAGDLTTRMQAAIAAAMAGMHAGAAVNRELTTELVLAGVV